MKGAAASARSLSAYAVARVLREGVTLDAALKDALVAADPKLFSAVRSLSYGAVRGYFRHEAILAKLLSAPVRSLDFLVRALLSVALYELEDRTHAGICRRRCSGDDREGHRCAACLGADQRRAAPLPAGAQGAGPGNRAQARHAPRRADLVGGSISRRLAGALDPIAGGQRRPSADVAAGQQPAWRPPPDISKNCAARGSRRAPRSACLTPLSWTRPATCRNCPASRKARSRCRTWARSVLRFPWRLSQGSAGPGCLRRSGRQNRADRGTGA